MVANLERFCHTCQFWEWDKDIVIAKKHIHIGHCGLYSGRCVNEVSTWSSGVPKPINYKEIEE